MIDSTANSLNPAIALPARNRVYPVKARPGRVRGGRRRGRIDRYLRRDDTVVAALLQAITRRRGAGYSSSRTKRVLDLLIAVPALLFALVPLGALLILNRVLYPRHPALFLQERVARSGMIRVIKIRSLLGGLPRKGKVSTGEGMAMTRFGFLIRRFYLDELPQLLQVLSGQLSIVGIRVLPVHVYEGLRRTWSEHQFSDWERAYGSSSLGLTGVHQVWRRNGKEDELRFHRDVFYARQASLGFDLYLIWKTFGRIFR